MGTNITIEKKEFSKDDIDLLIYEIYPKDKNNAIYSSLFLVMLIPKIPFLPARITTYSLIQSMSYEKALIFSTITSGLLIYGMYHYGLVRLNRDII